MRGTRFEVTARGTFRIELATDPSVKTSPESVGSVCEVSRDGCGIVVRHGDAPPQQYTVWDMPPELAALYDFATNVVAMLKSKTPKVNSSANFFSHVLCLYIVARYATSLVCFDNLFVPSTSPNVEMHTKGAAVATLLPVAPMVTLAHGL